MNHTRIIRYLTMFSVIATQLSPTHLCAGFYSYANKEQPKRQQSTKDKLANATASINFSKWGLSALALGGIAYGLYYLFSTPKAAPVPQQKPQYTPPNNQQNTQLNTKRTGYPKKQFPQQSRPKTKPQVNPHKQDVPNNLQIGRAHV